ncbi:glycosyltransferase family 2 protein [Croceivirga sp. JEA036]|uniref:glycosyltransferase family 2 protein n=1 Tax=Croceivirga sp. JEA036 TaxID=2721162 RepID=UPI00143C107C|nr:glycosyltransferase [Croceivirga sp. JEA036]NJB35393.1 glycosyltransferase family 2 protein [Croceivirga sp. JEA036]
MNVAVLLTCFNRVAKTLACLDNLFGHIPEELNLEVFLVDDGSTDGTGEAVRSNFPEVHVIQGTGSLYWNRGMHLAWQTAAAHKSFDIYLLLNDDTFLYEKALDELLEISKSLDHKAVICGAFCGVDSKEFTYGGRDAKGNPVVPNGNIQKCVSLNGNCLWIPKYVYNAVGNLDPIFPHAIGDFDYGQRALKKNITLVTTKTFIGTCESNPRLPAWCYSDVPFKKRIRSLYSPLGNSHPKYYFIYIKRHFGVLMAIKQFLSIHLRLLIPSLWKIK